MAGRPSKPFTLVKGHLTNAEKEVREKYEKSLVTSYTIKQWKNTKANVTAKKHFAKIKKAFAAIDQDDVLFEAVLNRYCIILGEEEETVARREMLLDAVKTHKERQDEIEAAEYVAKLVGLSEQISECDRILAKKRDMLLAIEKDNCMTVNAKLRAIPKKPVEDEQESETERLLMNGRPR